MKINIIAFTDAGFALALRLKEAMPDCETVLTNRRADKSMSLGEWTENAFKTAQGIVFIGACGIAVREIAPFVKSKLADPAVVVMDEKGQFAISLLSGHAGGANDLTLRIARAVDAIPVITTATDVNGRFAVDSWAVKHDMVIKNPQSIKWISGRLLAGETIKIRSEFPVSGAAPEGIELADNDEYDVIVSIRTKGKKNALRLVPRCLAVGIGTRKNIALSALEDAFEAAMKKGSIDTLAIKRICTIDLKANEPALLEFCRQRNLPLVTYSAAELCEVKGRFTSSEFVKKVTGVDNVCERSAVLGSGGKLIVRKDAGNGVTIAVAQSAVELSF